MTAATDAHPPSRGDGYLGVAGEVQRPAGIVRRVAHRLPARAATIEVAMRELDEGSLWRLGDERTSTLLARRSSVSSCQGSFRQSFGTARPSYM